MRVIVPQKITLISSNVPEDTTPLWDENTTYNTGDIVQVQNLEPNGISKLFQSLVDNNQGNYPPDHPDEWGDLGATNKWKCLDYFVSSQTENESEIDLVLEATRCNYVGVFGVEAHDLLVEVIDPDSGEVIFSDSRYLQVDGSSWFDYFFSDIEFKPTALVETPISTGTMHYHVKLTLGGMVKLGMVIIGRGNVLGTSIWSPRVGIRDFSVKETDEQTGYTYLSQGPFADRMEFDFQVPTNDVDRVRRVLASLRAIPCIWVGNNKYQNEAMSTDFESLIVYGFYKDFDIVLQGPVYSECSITVEGLI